jgi:hypothetical protein
VISKSLISSELIHEYYIDFLPQKKISELLTTQKKWEWISYILLPLIVFLRASLVSTSLNIGLFFYDTENKIYFKQLFKIALLGEFVLVLVGYVKFFYFTFFRTNYTLLDVQQFYPFSIINFFNIESLETWFIYPLQTVNLFEIGYFFVLVYGLHKLMRNNYWKSFEIIAISYGLGLLIWMGCVMFLTLNLN